MRFLHIADCHVGCRQYGMRAREEDFYKAFASAADIAVREKCDAVVVAGDLFDAVKPPAEAVCVVKEVVSELAKSGIDVFGIEGNHDLTGNDYWLRVCGIVPLDGRQREAGGVSLYGLNYRRSDELVAALKDMSEDLGEAEGPDVLVLHAGFVEMGDSFTGDLSVHAVLPYLKAMGVKYVALGHIHTPMEPVYDGIHFAQPGSTEVKDVQETLQKFAMLVEIKDGIVTQERLPVPTRPIDVVTVKDEDGLHGLLEGEETRGAFDGHLVVAYVANSIRDGVRRIEEAFDRHEVMYRISVYDDGNGTKAPEYDRKEAIPTLAAAVEAFFERDDERGRLVTEILETPANLRQIVERYLNEGRAA